MRIGIEMRLVALGSAGGISLLLKGVLENLFRRRPEHDFVIFSTVFNRSLFEGLPPKVEIVTFPTQTYLADVDRAANQRNLDVLFRAYPVEHQFKLPLARQIFLIPDIQHEYFPEFFDAECLRSRRVAFTSALSAGGAIGTISEFARQTLLEQSCTSCSDIFLMGPSLLESHRRASAEEVTPAEAALIPEGQFFLYPANLWPHKNHRRVLRAFAQFLEQTNRPVSLILTGHPDGWSDIQSEFSSLPVRHLGFVRAPLLRLLMKRACALSYFSLYEGFGMPLLEAFDAGLPVICSNTTSLPEVGGDAVLSCDPTDIPAMAALMSRMTQRDGVSNELIARGKERLKRFTWDQSADNLMAACERVTQAERAKVAVDRIEVREPPPLVSIVTPSYNQGRFLRRTIESVLTQNYPHIEYLVMDGGSKDESIEILKSYGTRFTWVSERDGGQTAAINKGFARSRGQIRAYLNSDDVLLPRAVERAVEHFKQHPECDLMYGRANYIDEDDVTTGLYKTDDYSFERMMRDCCICQPAAFWRTAIAERVGPFDESLNFVMDYDYWIRIDRAGGLVQHSHELLACSRLYAETKTLSCRGSIFKEIMATCVKHTGDVHIDFFKGYWHHLCRERLDGLPRRLRWVPSFQPGMAYIHHKWRNREKYTVKYLLAGVSRRFLAAVRRRIRRLMPRPLGNILVRFGLLPALAAGGRRVSGFWCDNHLEQQCRISVNTTMSSGQLFHLAGKALRNMELTIVAENKVVGRHQLNVNEYVKIQLPPTVKPGMQLHLKFSKYYVDSRRRHVSFLLQDTNLFAESELGVDALG